MRIFSFCIMFFIWSATSLCNSFTNGLIFRSYDYSKDERTSLMIPSPNKRLQFKNYLSLSFDLKIRTEGEHFGYVCRILLENQSNISLILVNPTNEDPYLCFIKDQQYLAKIQPQKTIDIYDWNTIKIELEVINDTLCIKEDGSIIAKDCQQLRQKLVRVCFGANELPNVSTSDVAPMILKNIRLSLNPKKEEHLWPLDTSSTSVIKAANSELIASVKNPEWMVDQHLYWKHIKTLKFNSKTYAVPNKNSCEIYFVSKNSIIYFDLISRQTDEYAMLHPINVDSLSNQFIVPSNSPENRQLAYYDFESSDVGTLSFFDFKSQKWSKPIRRTRQSIYNNHNKFYSTKDSSIVQIFGYGFHRYSSDMNRVSLSGQIARTKLPKILPPRYLSSIGETDSAVYIYGGLGNELGKQEYGVSNYHDLYKLNLNDYSLEQLWSFDSDSVYEVAAPSLIVDQEEKYAKGLFFTPHRFLSGLVLKDLNLMTGEFIPLGDTIPFKFLDVSSSAELLYSPGEEVYYAVTVHQETLTDYEANIYSIAAPVLQLPKEAISKHSSFSIYFPIVGALASCIVMGALLIFLRIHRSKRKTKYLVDVEKTDQSEGINANKGERDAKQNYILTNKHHQFARPTTTPGIYLLNGFQVIDQNVNDITGKFTPIMRQLLSAIVLFSSRSHKGISNTKLKELFWYDKSEESFSNNRSVNVRKIRLLLENVGDVEISSENGYWYFFNKGQVYIDYNASVELIDKMLPLNRVEVNDMHLLLRITSSGQLLPNLQFDWVDTFKADYSDSVINLLSKLRDSEQFKHDYKTKLSISNCLLKLDSLDEESLQVKCHSLIYLKRSRAAYNAFEQFTKEYKCILNESYKESFEQFVHKES